MNAAVMIDVIRTSEGPSRRRAHRTRDEAAVAAHQKALMEQGFPLMAAVGQVHDGALISR